MRTILGLLSLIFIIPYSYKQEEPKTEEATINFITGDLKDVLEKASRENKPVFIEVYASWCGSCKWMEKNIYNNEKVAGFYNTGFINYKVNIDEGDGPYISVRYRIKKVPSYLYLSPKGKVLLKDEGAKHEMEFVENGVNAIGAFTRE